MRHIIAPSTPVCWLYILYWPQSALCLRVMQCCKCDEVSLRNFNSPDHGSNLQHIKHQAKTNLIKSVVTGEPTKLLSRRSNCKLGNTKSKCSRHILTTCISVVLNNFMKKRLTTKSREASCDLFRGSASSPYNKIGTHLVLIRWITTITTSSEAMRPTLPKILLAGRTHV